MENRSVEAAEVREPVVADPNAPDDPARRSLGRPISRALPMPWRVADSHRARRIAGAIAGRPALHRLDPRLTPGEVLPLHLAPDPVCPVPFGQQRFQLARPQFPLLAVGWEHAHLRSIRLLGTGVLVRLFHPVRPALGRAGEFFTGAQARFACTEQYAEPGLPF